MTHTIKPLEWESFYGELEAKTPFYSYLIGRYAPELDNEWYWSYEGYIEGCSTLEAAKQAAQSHWEERLKGALEEVSDV